MLYFVLIFKIGFKIKIKIKTEEKLNINNKYKKENEELKDKILQLEKELKIAKKEAITDQLTGIYNRRELVKRYEQEKNLAQRSGHSFVAMFIDVDDFKKINDTHGHDTGDAVLKIIAFALAGTARNYDIYGRYSGDEFLWLLPNATLKGAKIAAERFRNTLKNVEFSGVSLNISVSIGICKYDKKNPDADPIKQADEAMYVAKKKSGKGQIHVFKAKK